MIDNNQIEVVLETRFQELLSARKLADERLRNVRQVKLGDLSLPETFYLDLKPVFALLCKHPTTKNAYFGNNDRGKRSRLLLLTFMSELIYWEYEHSFWQVFYDALDIESGHHQWSWFTRQMQIGFEENDIQLIISQYGTTTRREFVRTMVAQSGFSRQLVQKARELILWFFENHPDLDPRKLNTAIFSRIFEQIEFEGLEDILELLREMIRDVGSLLREIRKRSLSTSDLHDDEVLDELQQALGFHPVRGIFGFRDAHDIEELLDQLSIRIVPHRFHDYLGREVSRTKKPLHIQTPSEKVFETMNPEKIPVEYGVFQLMGIKHGEILVLPRESISPGRFKTMLSESHDIFHHDGPSHIWLHSRDTFEVDSGSSKVELPVPYKYENMEGYLWYGKQKPGIRLAAERGGKAFARLEPPSITHLSPKLFLNAERDGLQVVIPPLIFFNPDVAGETVRLEINQRPLGTETFLIGHTGYLQLQGRRTMSVMPEDRVLRVHLVSLDSGSVLAKGKIPEFLEQPLLFDNETGNLISPGHHNFASERFVLFARKEDDPPTLDGISVDRSGNFGNYVIHHISTHYEADDRRSCTISSGTCQWEFEHPISVRLRLSCKSLDPHFKPDDPHAAFQPNEIRLRLIIHNLNTPIEDLFADLFIILDQDTEFVADFNLKEMLRNSRLRSTKNVREYRFEMDQILQDILDDGLSNSITGSWGCSLLLRTDPSADFEHLDMKEFILLPELTLEGGDETFFESEESIVNILCDEPFLTDIEDQPSKVLPVRFVPGARLSPDLSGLRPATHQETFRLAYPPVKIRLQFTPTRLVAFHVLTGSKSNAAHGNFIDYSELNSSWLLALLPEGSKFQLQHGEEVIGLKADENGMSSYSLSVLQSAIQQYSNPVQIIFEDHVSQFVILWHPELHFNTDECLIDIDDKDTAKVKLKFKVNGPPETEIKFRIIDNNFITHAESTSCIDSLHRGRLNISLDPGSLSGAPAFFCVANAGSQRLDLVELFIQQEGLVKKPESLEDSLRESLSELREKSASELLEVSELLEGLNRPDLQKNVLDQMYSIRCLDEIYHGVKSGTTNETLVHTYFKNYEPARFPQIAQMPVPKLKKCCVVPSTELVATCSEALIMQGDGVGVDHIIEDLLLPGRIPLERGITILNQNKDCSSETIRDIIQWDELEKENDDYIDLMVRLSEIFHPPMARRAQATKDWKRAISIKATQQVIKCGILETDDHGLLVSFGLLTGHVPLNEFDAKFHGLYGDLYAIRRRLYRISGRSIHLVVIEADRMNNRLVLSEMRARKLVMKTLLRELQPGSILQGMVAGVNESGAFVDLGGGAGKIHRSRIRAGRDINPTEFLKPGDVVVVCVESLDQRRKHIHLSLLEKFKRSRLNDFKIGDEVEGTVTHADQEGVQVLIDGAIPGYVEKAEAVSSPEESVMDIVKAGDERTFRILQRDRRGQRLILSLRQVGAEELRLGKFRITM